jgi:hypothetical protein
MPSAFAGGVGAGANELTDLDRPAQLAEQGTDCWSKDNETGDSQNGDEGNNQAVFDQALRPVPRLLQHVKSVSSEAWSVPPSPAGLH